MRSSHTSASRQAVGVERVEASRAHGAHGYEPVLAQHAQVLRDGRLAYAEFGLDGRGDGASARLPGGEELEDAPPDGITQHVKCMHRCRYIICNL